MSQVVVSIHSKVCEYNEASGSISKVCVCVHARH